MNIKSLVLAAALGITALPSVRAALIASESFATPEGYLPGLSFGATNPPNELGDQLRDNVVGTTGFSDAWIGNTQIVQAAEGGLQHPLVKGPTAEGMAVLLTPIGQAGEASRATRRVLDGSPQGKEFYMSGLVSLGGSLDNIAAESKTAMGLTAGPVEGKRWAPGAASYDPGFALGVIREGAEDVYLAVFAGGEVYKLGEKLTEEQAAGTQMIVVRLEIGDGAKDKLTAWYAMDGRKELVEAISLSNLNIADSGADLEAFALTVMSEFPGRVGPQKVAFDEWRFGTALNDVVAK